MVGFGSSSEKQVAERVIVGVGDMSISDTPDVILSTYALGSCVGVVLYDAANAIGGLLHIMLPTSAVAAEKSKNQPYLFADTGVERFLSEMKSRGADVLKSHCVIAGGASVMNSSDSFKIGEKNGIAVKMRLAELGVDVSQEYLGGFSNRSLHLDLYAKRLTITLPNEKKEVHLS